MTLPGIFLFVPQNDDHIAKCLDLLREMVTHSPQGPAFVAGQDQAEAGLSQALHGCGIDPSDDAQSKALVVGMLIAVGTYQFNTGHTPASVAAIMGAMVLRVTEGLRPPSASPGL